MSVIRTKRGTNCRRRALALCLPDRGTYGALPFEPVASIKLAIPTPTPFADRAHRYHRGNRNHLDTAPLIIYLLAFALCNALSVWTLDSKYEFTRHCQNEK